MRHSPAGCHLPPTPQLCPAWPAWPASIPSLHPQHFCAFTLSALLKMKSSPFHLILSDKPFISRHRGRPIFPYRDRRPHPNFHHQSHFPLEPALPAVPVVPDGCPFLSPTRMPHISLNSSKAASSLPSFLLSFLLPASLFNLQSILILSLNMLGTYG